jgi:hypothetical protein
MDMLLLNFDPLIITVLCNFHCFGANFRLKSLLPSWFNEKES